ncbi:MAG TPA: biotin/lipoyl-binding protein, partial [Burkholderiales bacterium]|nr:biotin/lipoyl-binding protein [Burkholderiales bacterium]
MKIILGLYILICWLLVKFGVVKKTLGNMIAMGLGGVFVIFLVLTCTRYLAFIDMTASTTVKAPRIVLNSPAGGEIEKVFVTHNQRVKAGEPIYSFKTDRYQIEMASNRAEKARLQTQLKKLQNDLVRLGKLRGEVVAQAEYDAKLAEVETQRDLVTQADQAINDLQWKIDRAIVVAPEDGTVNVQYTSAGQYFSETRPSS